MTSSSGRLRPRPSVGLRLAATIALTIGLLGVVQYQLAARQLTKRIVDQTTSGHAADARVLQRLHEAAGAGDWAPVRELLGHISSRPGVKAVSLVGPDGDVVAEGRPAHHAGMADMPAAPADGHGAASEHRSTAGHGAAESAAEERRVALSEGLRPVVEQVRYSDTPYGGTDPRSDAGDGLFAVPVELAGATHVLVVVKEPGVVHDQLADVRWILLLTLGAGGVLAVPLFHVAGGRTLAARHARALRNSNEDALTGVGNHRAFHEELGRIVDVAQRRDGVLSLALIVIDYFKTVNDTQGHAAGDQVLADAARIFAEKRLEHHPFRIGGDEFALVLPDADAASASTAAERIRMRIEAEVPGITTSIGVAQLGSPAADKDSLVACADLALYEAKAAGRNAVATFGGRDRSPIHHRRR